MFRIFEHYDNISTEILRNLFIFSKQIMCMTNSIHILLENEAFDIDSYFYNFVESFKKGRYYHYRCQGYMESLVLTKCYSPFSISYWIYQLVEPAAQHFSEALDYLDEWKEYSHISPNKEFQKLLDTTVEFKKTSEEIMRLIKTYNLQY